MTAGELFARSAELGRCQLVRGELTMMSPAGPQHGRIANRIAYLLSRHVDEHGLGVVFAAETGFVIESDPDTVLAADVSFVRQDIYEPLADEQRFLRVAPDLVVEVISPSDSFHQIESKSFRWIDGGGVRLVLLADPDGSSIHAYRSRREMQLCESGVIDCTDAVPGWLLDVEAVFKR